MATLELLTARGPGAIAVAQLSGEDAEAVLQAAFRPARGRFDAGRVHVGTIEDADEVVLARVEGGFEICGHGGAGAIARLFRRLGGASGPAGAGGSPAPALALARTWLAFRVLSWRAAGLLDASWDHAVDALARPRRVVLAGAPNAGKSSLFNALLERDRSIVSAEPGTTRDVIEEECALEGVPVLLCDAAGVCDSEDELGKAAAHRARKAAREADLVLHVIDGSAEWPPLSEGEGWGDGVGKLEMVVLTKCDLPGAVAIPGALRVSAKTGENLDTLSLAIATRLLGRDPRGVSRPAQERGVEGGRRFAALRCPPQIPPERPR